MCRYQKINNKFKPFLAVSSKNEKPKSSSNFVQKHKTVSVELGDT